MRLNPDRYLGLPYAQGGRSREGVDCYGLVLMVYREVWEIELEDWRYSTDPGSRLSKIYDVASSGPWEQVDEPQTGDVGHMHPAHLCIYTRDNRALQASERANSVVHLTLDTPPDCNRLQQWYRHARLV